MKAKVAVYNYTIHVTKSKLADKMNTCVFFRHAKRGNSLLVALLQSLTIADVSSECLTQLLKHHNVNMRKNATKLCKIRALSKIESVLKDLTAEEATAVETMLQDMESKTAKKKNDHEDDIEERDCDTQHRLSL